MKNQNTALIIIDMQRGMATPEAGPRNNPGAEENIRQLLLAWREAGRSVVFVRHMSRSPGSLFWPGQPGNEFQENLLPLASEHVVEKNVTDAFAHTGLERWLHVRAIKDLVIVGVSTNNSVEATARSAGNLGFNTTVVADACFSFDRLDLRGKPQTAEEVHINALSNLQGEYATVLDTAELLH
ncbi:cysteine hydrolase family protein [Undibacterium sp. Ji42W]|uniref:cysteine hydrolase family protein n=1 Tax=Undibacterium sp. Ji42W TaxID=3413039 RepID=UPI003BF17838